MVTKAIMTEKTVPKKVCIYLADLVHNYSPGNYVVPLNVASIANYLMKNFGSAIEIRLFKYPDELLRSIEKRQPDILGLSNYFWNNELNRVIGTEIRQKYPEILTVMGGPSIRVDPDGIKAFLKQRPFLDLYIMFEGEQPFSDLIQKYLQNNGITSNPDFKKIDGCASLSPQGELVYTPHKPLENLSVLPSPYLTGLLDEFLLQGLIPLFESNRGCPFTCTFCTWGISAQKKVRLFPLDRILDEMDYVSQKIPNSPFWIFADANFGIVPRDVDIAQRIGEIRKKNPSLTRVVIFNSKNQPERIKKISHLIGSFERTLIAVQTWDEIVEKNIKRTNIKKEDAFNLVREIKQEKGREVQTDILCGLPGETYQSHLTTLRMAFDAGFDFLDVVNVLMLPGSEMETDESRKKFGLQTKYRVRQGSFGEYHGIPAIEYEEIIRSTDSFGEDQMLRCRLIHWLVWLCWNAGFLKPFLLCLQQENQINPLDFMLRIIDEDKSDFPKLQEFFEKFISEAKGEWFNTPEELKAFYSEQNNWAELLEKGFAKMNFSYTAELILDQELRDEFYNFLEDMIKDYTSNTTLKDILLISRENHISPVDMILNKAFTDKTFNTSLKTATYLCPSSATGSDAPKSSFRIVLKPNEVKISTIRDFLIQRGFQTDQHHAVQKTLEYFMTAFQYEIQENPS